MSNDLHDIKKNGWNEWAKYVLNTLEELKDQFQKSEKTRAEDKEKIQESLAKLHTSIKVLETRITIRASLAGALTALVPLAVALTIWLLTN